MDEKRVRAAYTPAIGVNTLDSLAFFLSFIFIFLFVIASARGLFHKRGLFINRNEISLKIGDSNELFFFMNIHEIIWKIYHSAQKVNEKFEEWHRWDITFGNWTYLFSGKTFSNPQTGMIRKNWNFSKFYFIHEYCNTFKCNLNRLLFINFEQSIVWI